MKTSQIKTYDKSFIEAAKKILEQDPTTNLTITDLALHVGINSCKLKTGFKLLYKTSVHQFRIHLRLQMARQLLDETDMTVSEIAYKIGFDSRDGFARCFRRKFSRPPSEWRKKQTTAVEPARKSYLMSYII